MVIFVDLACSEHEERETLTVFTSANELGFEQDFLPRPVAYVGGFLALSIRLATRALEPFHLASPKFLPFGHIMAKLQVNSSARGLLQSFFEREVMKKKGYGHFYFYFCLKWLKFIGGTTWENNCWP